MGMEVLKYNMVYIFSSGNGGLRRFCELAEVHLSYGYSFNIASKREITFELFLKFSAICKRKNEETFYTL